MAEAKKLKRLLNFPLYIVRGLKYYAAGRFYLPKPKRFCLVVTDRCNARCIMCSSWKKKCTQEPTPDKIGAIFSNPLLDRLDRVLVSGGEPTLREDLPQIAQAILNANHAVQYLNIVSNGIEPSLVEQRMQDILKLPDFKRLKGSTFIVSLDGTSEVHDKIRGVPHAFERASESIERLKRLQNDFPLRIVINCIVQKSNVSNLPQLYAFARKVKLPISFWPVVIKIDDKNIFKQQQEPTLNQLETLEHFFSDHIELSLAERVFWRDYFRIMRGSKRRLPCSAPYRNLFLRANGDVYACAMSNLIDPKAYGNVYDDDLDKIWHSKKAKEIRKNIKKCICPTCPSACRIFFSLRDEVFYSARYLLKERVKRR